MTKTLRYFILLTTIYCSSLLATDIVFDIFGVLVYIPMSKQIKHTGIKEAFGYLLKERRNIVKIKSAYLNTLAKINLEDEKLGRYVSSETKTVRGEVMPDIMFSWLAGLTDYQEVLTRVQKHLNENNYSKYKKRIFTNISNLTFDLATRKESYRLLKKGIALLQRFAAEKNERGEKRHRLFVISNMDEEMMTHLRKTYPWVFELFDDIVYSAKTSSLKPNPHIFNVLIERNNLDPKNCLYIDDQQENVDQAIKLGMHGMVFHPHKNIAKKLEDKGFLLKRSHALPNVKHNQAPLVGAD